MKLPQNSIGITDLVAHRECPRRMSYGMKRHTGIGLQSDDKTPESGGYATDYGSAIHLVIQELSNGCDLETAVSIAWKEWGHRLGPTDLERLEKDAEIYAGRDFPNTRTLAAEDEFRVPLFAHPVHGQIYFRFKLDRLYERVDSPGTFIGVDYKSSRWAKSEAEVHEDLQQWAYNWGISEFWPECQTLIQIYDQLNYGQVVTRKTDAQRDQMKSWLIEAASALLEDEDVRDDGLLKPRKNKWCAYCPIMDSCPVVPELSEFARVEIEALAPSAKVGRKIELDIDPARISEYVERMEDAKQAVVILERFVETIRDMVKAMPEEDRLSLGYSTKTRSKSTFTIQARRKLHERLGEEFYSLANVTKTGLQSLLGEDEELLKWALELADVGDGAVVLSKT